MNRRWLRRLDLYLLGATLVIMIMGLIVIGSATHINDTGTGRFWFFERQAISAVINILLASFFIQYDYKDLQRYGNRFYIFNIILLLFVIFIGHTALGAQRWIQIGPISIQPSEFSKLFIIISLASIMADKIGKFNTVQDVLPIALYIAIPFFLVLKQPDLGTSLVFVAIFFGMIFASGINLKILGGVFALGTISLPILWLFLKDYQKMRIMVFIDPNVDPLGSGYHIIQSKIAIGSGMLFGKGLFGGTQSQLNFLPENHTDFIFAVVGEELGFVGAAFLILLYLVILWRGVQIAREATDSFGMLLAVGITSMIGFHVLVNIGMTVGIMPVTGIPLPFMSYGISSLTTNIMAIAILLNIHMKKQKLLF